MDQSYGQVIGYMKKWRARYGFIITDKHLVVPRITRLPTGEGLAAGRVPRATAANAPAYDPDSSGFDISFADTTTSFVDDNPAAWTPVYLSNLNKNEADVAEMEAALNTAWRKVERPFIDRLIDSVARRLETVHLARGEYAGYQTVESGLPNNILIVFVRLHLTELWSIESGDIICSSWGMWCQVAGGTLWEMVVLSGPFWAVPGFSLAISISIIRLMVLNYLR